MADGPDLAALDLKLARALAERAAAARPRSPDEAAIALRATLAAVPDAPRALAIDLWRRLQAEADRRPTVVWGAPADAAGVGLVEAVADPMRALDRAEAGARAVLALGTGRAWWGRMLARPALRVTGALPETGRGVPSALIVTAERDGPTGDDRTFWVTDAPGSAAEVVAALSAAGLAAAPVEVAGGLKLFAIAGYVQDEDARLQAAPGGLSGVIGAAPVF